MIACHARGKRRPVELGQSDAGRADLYAIHDELELVNGAGSGQGPCAWSDSGGDKIFTNHPDKIAASGALSGVHQITGGTGKGYPGQGPVPNAPP
jgi:hypothetical protein